MTIESDDVRRLLDADGDAVLVLVEGRVDVVAAERLDDDAHRGALRVISRTQLVERVGGDVSGDELSTQAAILDAETAELGG